MRPRRQSRLDSLHRHLNIRIAGVKSIVIGQNHLLRPVGAEGGFVVAADDGEGVEDVGGVIAGEAVEVEVEGVEAGAQVAALFFIPDEGRAVLVDHLLNDSLSFQDSTNILKDCLNIPFRKSNLS